jgi:translation initiation factor IF-1
MQPNLQPTSSPLERLETTTEALILSQHQSSQKTVETLQGLEPVMEALVVSYTDGAKQIAQSIKSIEKYLSKIEPVAVNDKMLPLLKKLDNTFNRRNIFTVPEPTVINDSRETVKAIRDLIETVDLKPMEVNLENDFTQIEKALGRIEKLIKIEIPTEDGRVKVKLSDADLERIGKSMTFYGGTATAQEETLLLIKQQLIPTELYASINASGSGNNTLVEAVSGRRIKVLDYTFVCSGAVAAKFRSDDTDLTGAMDFVANSGVSSPKGSISQGAILATQAGEALNLNLSSAVQVSGHFTYFLD